MSSGRECHRVVVARSNCSGMRVERRSPRSVTNAQPLHFVGVFIYINQRRSYSAFHAAVHVLHFIPTRERIKIIDWFTKLMFFIDLYFDFWPWRSCVCQMSLDQPLHKSWQPYDLTLWSYDSIQCGRLGTCAVSHDLWVGDINNHTLRIAGPDRPTTFITRGSDDNLRPFISEHFHCSSDFCYFKASFSDPLPTILEEFCFGFSICLPVSE